MRRIVLAAAGAAVAGVAACSHPAAPASVSGTHGTSSAQSGSGSAAGGGSAAGSGGSGGSSVPVSCGQRYHAWVGGAGKSLLATFHAVSVAAATGDSQALTVALDNAKPAVTGATLHPVPACADPRGYWGVLLMHVNAAVSGHPSAPSVRAALKDVPAIEHALTAELTSASR